MPQPDHDYQIYADQLAVLGHGLPLWQPTPLYYDKVNVGDVGYVHQGCFHRLFNATLPASHKDNKNRVPRDFVPLDLGTSGIPGTKWTQPRIPRALHTEHINAKGLGFDISAIPSWIEAGGRVQFESKASQGAILITNHKTYREDAVREPRFEKYMLRHYESWLEFASADDLGIGLEDLILVTGYDVTSEYAMAAFSNTSRDVGIEFKAGPTPLASVSFSVWGTWQSTTSVHHNCGPQTRVPPSITSDSSPLAITSSSSASEIQETPNAAPADYTQCVFLRRVQMRKRAALFPTIIKAAAGPHDLGSGHRHDEFAPSVLAQATEIPDLPEGDDVVVIFDTSPFRDPLEPIFRYIFANSRADVAIVHDMDLLALLKTKPASLQPGDDMETLVQRAAPEIDVELDGVARIRPSLDSGLPLRYQVDLPFYAAREGFDDLAALAFDPELEPAVENLVKTFKSLKGLQVFRAECEQLAHGYTEILKHSTPEMGIQRAETFDAIYRLATNVHTWFTLEVTGSLTHRTSIQSEVKEMQSRLAEDRRRCGIERQILTMPAVNLELIAERSEVTAMPPSTPGLMEPHGSSSFSRFRDPSPHPVHFALGTTLSQAHETLNEVDWHLPEKDAFDRNSKHCLDGRITRIKSCVASGGFADVYEGLFESRKVAIKVLRPFSYGGPIGQSKQLRRLWREYTSWTRISHPNVLECLGFSYDFSPELPSLISPWASHGSVPSFLETHPELDRLELLLGIAQGLSHLHDQNTIHGDIRGGNILISDSCVPLLHDFGLARYLPSEEMSTDDDDDEVAGSLRWMSPELLGDAAVTTSKSSDVWAFGITVLEIISGNRPYHELMYEPLVLRHILDGKIPLRPQDAQSCSILTDEVWSMCQQCWSLKPTERPSMPIVISRLTVAQNRRGNDQIHRREPSVRLVPALSSAESHSVLGKAFDKEAKFCLDGLVTRQQRDPAARGDYTDIWEGFMGNQKVAIKVIRSSLGASKRIAGSKMLKRLWDEYLTWISVSHPNVLKCLGYSYDLSPEFYVFPSLITPWMSNGILTMYLEAYPDTNRLELLLGIAEGLCYLHTRKPPIVHRDVRAWNIMVSDSGVPCLSGFGFFRILGETRGMTSSIEIAGALRWTSPELLRDNPVTSPSSDVWAYGMTALEIMSGNRPYHEQKSQASVLGEIREGQIPSRPQEMKLSSSLADEVWAICKQCWSIEPTQRPSMRVVIDSPLFRETPVMKKT